MAYIDSHAHDPIRPEQLAQLAGVSLRSLYSGFQNFRGMTPMQYLRRVRLERVRAELVGSSNVPSVASAAYRWGFGHLGRFSADYRARFGEAPSDTIRNR